MDLDQVPAAAAVVAAPLITAEVDLLMVMKPAQLLMEQLPVATNMNK